ncbi:BCAN [Branchiostoma lanceolatum]|uniref:BCAN protein n=1 Tax=Branchiostoma lanceolatum TaxID=7740 RepID=A0A8J9VCG9_BRALA|nr:BCAN [Branchiostoma lanceolatum]
MYAGRLPCVKSNRFVSGNSFCDGFPDCHDASDEDACIDIGACLLPISLIVEGYTFDEGIGASHPKQGRRGLSLTEWVIESLEDWLQITLKNPVQLAAIVVSGSRSSHPPAFTLRYGLRANCLATYMDGKEVKVFQTPELSANSYEHYLAIAVYTSVVRVTPQHLLDMAVLDVGLLGCPIKDRFKDKTCGKGWTMFNGTCYQKFTSPLVWWASERYCQALGGHLAAVNTPEENEFLRNSIGSGWIGMKLDAIVMKKQWEIMGNFTWTNGSPTGHAFREQDIAFDVFLEYLWRLNDPFCAVLELHGPWSLQPCSLVEKEFICEKDPSLNHEDDRQNTTHCFDPDLTETGENELNRNIPDMTVCDDCMAHETTCGNIRCGLPDDYRCGLIYSPGYPTAFPSSVICLWTIDGPRGSYVSLLLLDVDLPGYSRGACTSRVLQIRDRFLAVRWNNIHGLCSNDDDQKLYVSSSNDMQLAMLATSNNAVIGGSRGFMATFNISTFIPSRQVQNLPQDAGFYDVYRNRTFVWTDGIPVTFTDWSLMDLRTGFPQPDGAKINYCVAIVMKNVWGTDQWYDVPCDEQDTRSFICKRKAERVTHLGSNA